MQKNYKTYGDLNLKKLRDKCGLDFAHYTYLRWQCSCCYAPWDLPSTYWKNGHIPETEEEQDNSKWILFKNADNGSGAVTQYNRICSNGPVFVEWSSDTIDEKLLAKICKELQKQLGDGYIVIAPENKSKCIKICKRMQAEF